MNNTSTNVGITAHKKVFEETELLNIQPYFPQRKKMTETWSPGRLEWLLSDNLIIVLLLFGVSLPESSNIMVNV